MGVGWYCRVCPGAIRPLRPDTTGPWSDHRPAFLPLAKIFRTPRYYWTGGIMVVAALGSLLIHRGYIRNIFGCGAVGLTLWVSAVAILSRTSSALVGQTESNIQTTC
jgi:hypothetical protein